MTEPHLQGVRCPGQRLAGTAEERDRGIERNYRTLGRAFAAWTRQGDDPAILAYRFGVKDFHLLGEWGTRFRELGCARRAFGGEQRHLPIRSACRDRDG